MLVYQAVKRPGDMLWRYSARFDVLLVGNAHEGVPEFGAVESFGIVGLLVETQCLKVRCLVYGLPNMGLRD